MLRAWPCGPPRKCGGRDRACRRAGRPARRATGRPGPPAARLWTAAAAGRPRAPGVASRPARSVVAGRRQVGQRQHRCGAGRIRIVCGSAPPRRARASSSAARPSCIRAERSPAPRRGRRQPPRLPSIPWRPRTHPDSRRSGPGRRFGSPARRAKSASTKRPWPGRRARPNPGQRRRAIQGPAGGGRSPIDTNRLASSSGRARARRSHRGGPARGRPREAVSASP